MSVYSDQAPNPVAAVVILAAGEGKRMKSSRSKLLHEIAGHSMLSYAVTAATVVQPEHIVVVVGHLRDQVEAHLAEIAPHVLIAVQEQQLGTGDAVQAALGQLANLNGDVIVTYGDVPMLTGETLAALLQEHHAQQAAVTVLTAEVPDPTGYGRILRDGDGLVSGIVEHRDADDAQRLITEINSGIYVFDSATLATALTEITPANDQGELYLTDVVTVVRKTEKPVAALLIDDLWQTEGVNDRIQLSRMNAEVNRRILQHWMREGVTVLDPATTWVHASVDLAPDVILLPGTSLEGATSIGAGARIGPDTTLIDMEIGENAVVSRTQASLSVIGARRQRRPVCLPAARYDARCRRQDRHFCGGQERAYRGRRQGAPPQLPRRCRDRRGRQHRSGRDLCQLRRRTQVDQHRWRVLLRRQQFGTCRAGRGRRRRLHCSRFNDHR